MTMSSLLTTTDQMGRKVTFSYPPGRIVSLVPSQTEFLVDIGAPLVGRTKFCIHPQPEVQEIPVIGGTKNFRFEKIKSLQPDLIIGNKEENYKDRILALEKDFPVWMSDIYTLDDAFEMMGALGCLCNRERRSHQIILGCKGAVERIKNTGGGTVIYLIWQDPWMAAGKHTFIDHLLTQLGYENVIKGDRYPVLTNEEVTDLNPDYIFLSSEPYPFKKKHLNSVMDRWPHIECRLVDGALYSWYGSRLRMWS